MENNNTGKLSKKTLFLIILVVVGLIATIASKVYQHYKAQNEDTEITGEINLTGAEVGDDDIGSFEISDDMEEVDYNICYIEDITPLDDTDIPVMVLAEIKDEVNDYMQLAGYSRVVLNIIPDSVSDNGNVLKFNCSMNTCEDTLHVTIKYLENDFSFYVSQP